MTGVEVALVGAAASAASAGTAATAATAGLIGSGGMLFGVSGLTLGTALTGLSAISGIAGAVSSVQSQNEAAEFNARQAAEQSAAIAIESEQRQKAERREQFLERGRNVAAAASRGGAGADSAFDLLADSAIQSEFDLLTIKQNQRSQQRSVQTDERLRQPSPLRQRIGIASSVLTGGSRLLGDS